MMQQTKPLAEITDNAIKVLYQELGIVNTIRFLNQFTRGYGNFTEERNELFHGLTIDQIVTEIKQTRDR